MPTQNPGKPKADNGGARKSKRHNCDGKRNKIEPQKCLEEYGPFRTFPIHEKSKKLKLGSNIIARINPLEVPGDFEVQAYSGSTSEEKLAITSQWEKKKLKTVTIQNGANNVLKHYNQAVEKVFQHHQDLIKQMQANHELQKVLLCEIPPKTDSEDLSVWNEKIDALNHMLTQRYEHNECYQIITLNALLASKKNMTANYHKSIHLNNAMGTLFLQNLFLSFLLTHSENILGVRNVQT